MNLYTFFAACVCVYLIDWQHEIFQRKQAYARIMLCLLLQFGIFAQQSDMDALVARAASKKHSTQNRILVHIPSFVRTIAGEGRWQQEMDIIDDRVQTFAAYLHVVCLSCVCVCVCVCVWNAFYLHKCCYDRHESFFDLFFRSFTRSFIRLLVHSSACLPACLSSHIHGLRGWS